MKKLNILIMGGTGFIGRALSTALHGAGHSITVVSRRPATDISLQCEINFICANITLPGSWQKLVQDFDIVINLAGDSIFRRWTASGKKTILESRISSAKNIVDALRVCKGKTNQLFSVSGVGYYGFHGDEILTENDKRGSDFLATVASHWEEEAMQVKELGIRPVILRFGHVLGTDGGVLPKLITLVKLYLASRWGNGEQWISWVHEKDLAGSILFLLNNYNISGPVNICAPNPVRNREMMQLLAAMVGRRPLIPPVPEFILKLITGEFASVFLNGQRVIPRVLQERGFVFQYPDLEKALEALLQTPGLMYNKNIKDSHDSG